MKHLIRKIRFLSLVSAMGLTFVVGACVADAPAGVSPDATAAGIDTPVVEDLEFETTPGANDSGYEATSNAFNTEVALELSESEVNETPDPSLSALQTEIAISDATEYPEGFTGDAEAEATIASMQTEIAAEGEPEQPLDESAEIVVNPTIQPDSPILGSWQALDEATGAVIPDYEVAFNQDAFCIWASLPCDYSLEANNTIEIRGLGEYTYTYTISKDPNSGKNKMVLKNVSETVVLVHK